MANVTAILHQITTSWRTLLLATTISCSLTAMADTTDTDNSALGDSITVLRPVNSAYQVEFGSSHLGDTYLSPLKYVGIHAAFQYERLQAMKFSPDRWRQQLRLSVEGSSALNPNRNNHMYYVNANATWGMMRVWRLNHGLSVAFGGSAGGDIGTTYNRRNGNNPASIKADITANLTGYATWNTRLWRLPVLLRWQTTLPVVGAFFSQEYDELYYEIYLGNSSNLAHCAWLGNYFRWNNLVTADLDLSFTKLRVGFSSRIYSTEVNNITTRIFSYAFVIGASGDWLSVSPHRGVSPETSRIVYAY
jgi:hypothetical protein